ncbi:hypothetical protein [Citrifermentans bremense]|uniref:hypothetical protein n=1 Tax=Citrifermentans bremense TaxID=60035 RepID=UPI0003FAD69D|nr:hypothetical protein [Citrifermentans bremense]
MSDQQMGGVERFEKNVLFGIVRWFSLVMGALGLIVLVIGGMMLFKSWTAMSDAKEIKISFSEVQQKVQEEKRNEQGAQPETPAETSAPTSGTPGAPAEEVSKTDKILIEIVALLVKDTGSEQPEEVTQRFAKILKDKVSAVEENHHEEFLTSMKEVVGKAPAGEKGNYTDKYLESYFEKNAKAKAEAEVKKFDAIKNLGIYAYLTVAGLLTAVSFGIILILAAIERNTRTRLSVG